ncbi:hypothetical protein JB92DRAFT_2853005 [Gautieria morchelliformis]|nr:hypothetical protein JB92DRAFT_2853005 [Gautieria morchelliformis]
MSHETQRSAKDQHTIADSSIAEGGLPGTETSGDSEIKMTTGSQEVKHYGYSDPGLPRSNIDTNYWYSTSRGSLDYLELSEDDIATAMHRMSEKPPTVGQLRGTSLPGNSMTSSVFYAFPAVTAASPIFLELGSAIQLNGGNYAYLLQVSGTTLGLLGAAATLLDSVVTSTESAATAASYLRGEFTSSLAVSEAAITIALLTGLAILCLVNVRDAHRAVHPWLPRGTSNTARAIFNGICIGFLGVTGFETTPTYIEAIHPDAYGPVLRNILFCTLFLNAPLMLMVYAVLPEQTINSGTNILSILAETVAGRWLRILVVVDAILVLAGGVIDGICSACALLDRLANLGGDQVFSEALLKTLPVTGSQYILIIFCFALNILLYAVSAFSLTTISAVFTVTILSTLLLFVLSDILLKFNRDRLPRSHKSNLLAVFITLAVVIVLLVGNISPNPKILALFAIYFFATLLPLLAMQAEDPAARVLLWLYYQSRLHKLRWTEGWDMKLIDIVKRARRHPVCVWVGRGDTMNLMNFILYIRNNEITSHVTFVHAYRDIESILSELAPNIKLLDEASTFTIDLMFVRGNFEPALVEAVSAKTGIPRSKMFMSCPSESHGWEIGDYQGIRVVTQC